MKKRVSSTNPLLITDKNEQIRRYNRGEVSQLFSDKEKEQAQNEIRLFIQNANDQVSENEQSYSILFDRYQRDVGYSEAKETIKNTFDSASTFGRKIQNDLLKNEIKRRQLKFYAKNYDENYQFRKEIESKGYSQQEFVNTVETNYKALLNEKNKLESREEKRKEIYQSAKDVYLTESEKIISLFSKCTLNLIIILAMMKKHLLLMRHKR